MAHQRTCAKPRAEATAYGVKILNGSATRAVVLDDPEPGASRFTLDVHSHDGSLTTVSAWRLLLATGLVDVLPQVEGLADRWGKDVLHCPFCHGWEVRDQAIGVLGSSPMAVHQVLLFRQLSKDVVYFQHTASDPNDEQVEQLAAIGVQWIVGQVAAVTTANGALSGVRMTDGRLIARQALGVGPTFAGREDLLTDLGSAMSDLEVGGSVLGRFLVLQRHSREMVSTSAVVTSAGLVLAPAPLGGPVPDVFDSVMGNENQLGQETSDLR